MTFSLPLPDFRPKIDKKGRFVFDSLNEMKASMPERFHVFT